MNNFRKMHARFKVDANLVSTKRFNSVQMVLMFTRIYRTLINTGENKQKPTLEQNKYTLETGSAMALVKGSRTSNCERSGSSTVCRPYLLPIIYYIIHTHTKRKHSYYITTYKNL